MNILEKPIKDSGVDILSPKKGCLNIWMLVGVNGVGKTTTIGKIGKIFKDNGSEVLFSACDTFRAAAIEQLEAWSGKVGVPIIKSDPGSDPASVAYLSLIHI